MIHRQHRSARLTRLLTWEEASLQRFLDSFEVAANTGKRTAELGRTREFIVIRNLPLPDGYAPDFVDALLIVDNYPAIPPIGLYVLNTPENKSVVSSLSKTFNVFANKAFHDAPRLEGYTWICYHYSNNRWSFNANEPHKGDNITKFVSNFYAECEIRR